MPRIKRWFPVSHDINSDPEVLDLTDKFGLAGLKVWLEILSIADRNDGAFGNDWKSIARALSVKCNTTQSRVMLILDLIVTRTWVTRDSPARVVKFAEYHKTRGTNKAPSEPSEPTRPSKKHKNASLVPPPAEALELAQLLSDRIFANFPNRTAPTEVQLMSWARDAEKLYRIDLHAWSEIEAMIEWAQQDDFWRANILSMSKLREKWNQLNAKKEKKPYVQPAPEPKGLAALREWRRIKGADSR